MKPDDLMWNIFCNTGRIGDYLLYSELSKDKMRDEYGADKSPGADTSQHSLR